MSTAKGRSGEAVAAAHLRCLGLTIVTRNYRGGSGEVDLVALDGETYVFIEVKARAGGLGALAVDAPKARRIASAAAAFLREAGVEPEEVRFDIVEVDARSGEVTHYPDAFR